MSTKALQAALELLRDAEACAGEPDFYTKAEVAALTELNDIRQAARWMTALAPAELVEAFAKNPKDQAVLKWLSGYDLLIGISRERP